MRLAVAIATLLAGAGCDCDAESAHGAADASTDQDAGVDDGGLRIHGRRVEVPARVEVDLGARATVQVTLVAGDAPWSTTVVVEAPAHTWIDDVAGGAGTIGIQAIELEAGQQATVALTLRTLLTWRHELTVWVLGEPYVIPVDVRLVPPLLGLSAFACDGPHVLVYGPDCGACGLETTDATCAAPLLSESCHPIGPRIPAGTDEAPAVAACNAGAAFASQIERALPSSFWALANGRGTVDVTELEWIGATLAAGGRSRPMPSSGYWAWWMATCPDCANLDGSRGPYDPTNEAVMSGLEGLGARLGALDGVASLELADRVSTLVFLCPCLFYPGRVCGAPSGPDQTACGLPDPFYTEELGAVYGPLLAAVATRFGNGVHAASPTAIVVSPPVDLPSQGLTPLTRVALGAGLRAGIDALGVTASPYPAPTWIDPPPDCAGTAGAAVGCETAPPLEDWTILVTPKDGGDPVPTPVSALEAWRAFDRGVDPDELRAALAEAGHADLPLWYSPMRAGFHGPEPREVLAAFRIAAILSGAGVQGIELAFAPSDPAAFELLAYTFAGASAVVRPETTAGYDGVVLRFLGRPGEDELVAWSNAAAPSVLTVSSATPLSVTRLRAGVTLEVTQESPEGDPAEIPLSPLSEIVIVRTIGAEGTFRVEP